MNKTKGYISIIVAGVIALMTLSLGVALNSKTSNLAVGGGSGTVTPLPVRTFLGLTDSPDSYSGQGGKGVRVNAGASALEFYTITAGGSITLDFGDDGGNDSIALSEIATSGDTNSIFTEPSADKLLINLANDWPKADLADALNANGANCSAGSAPLGVSATGAAESCFDVWTEAENTSAAYISGNQSITLSGDVSGTGATAITTAIGNDKITEAMLKVVDAGNDEECLTYETTTGDFEWQACSGASGATTALDNLASVAINTTLVSDTDNTDALGTAAIGWSDLFLGSGAVITFSTAPSTADVTLTHSANTLTLAGGDLALGTNSLTLTGSIGATGARVTKGWFTDLEVTNAIVGSITGNSATATALAANPSDCAANQFAISIVASGNLTCAAIADADVPNNITIDLATLATTVTVSDAGEDTTTFPLLAIDATGSLGPRTDAGLSYQGTTNALTATTFIGALSGNATTATALAADPADCSSNQFAHTIAASGALTCSALTLAGAQFANQGTTTTVLHGNASGNPSWSAIVSADITDGTISAADTALTAGRSLTLSTNDFSVDAEAYTDTKCIYFANPTASDDLKSIWMSKQASTLTSIWAESDQTVTFMLQVDDGTPADVDSVDLAPAAGTAEDTSLNGDATMASGDRLDIDLVSVASTPTWVSICWTFTYDD